MKARTLVRFRDKAENVYREIGEEFELSEERFDEISSVKGYGQLIERVEEQPEETVELEAQPEEPAETEAQTEDEQAPRRTPRKR